MNDTEQAESLESGPAGAESPSQSADAPSSFAENLDAAAPSISQRDHEAALAAEKEKALKEWRDQHGWAESITPDQRQWLADLASRAQTDPVTLAREMLVNAARNPRYRHQVEALIGGLAPRQASVPVPTAADEEPPPDLQLPDGRLLYSAEQLAKWHQWSDKRNEQKLAERLKPYDDVRERMERQEQVAADWNNAVGSANAFKPYLESLPGFKDNKDAILKTYSQMRFENEQQAQMGIMAAYHHVVLPLLEAQGTMKAAADHARRAAASTARPTGTQAVAPNKKPLKFGERLAEAFEKSQSA